MKQYLPGLIAIVLAITAFAFTDAPFRKTDSNSTKASTTDFCNENAKKWYLIQLNCSSQSSISDLRNPMNYLQSDIQEVNYLCAGSECVCAIWACPSVSSPNLPTINSSTQIYNDLYNFFKWGMLSSSIALKDEVYEQRRR